VGGGGRRAHLFPRRRRRRRRLRPPRRRRIRLADRRSPRRLLTNRRLNRIQLSRSNIQLHPTISRTQSASSSVPHLVSYLPSGTQYVSKATGAVQYLTVPDYSSTGSQASPVFIQLQKPPPSSSRLGLVDDIGLTDRKATRNFNNRQEGNFGSYATMTNGNVVVPVALSQSQLDFTSLPSHEVLVPLQVYILRRTNCLKPGFLYPS